MRYLHFFNFQIIDTAKSKDVLAVARDLGRLVWRQAKGYWVRLVHFPVYPLLLCLAPVLILFQHNRGELNLSELVMPIGAAVCMTAALFLILRAVFRSWYKAALILAAFVLVFFSYGYIKDYLTALPLPQVINPNLSSFGWNKILYLLFAVFGLALVGWVWRSNHSFIKLAPSFNLVTAILLAFPIVSIGVVAWQTFSPGADLLEDSSAVADSGIASVKRDIYYLIPEDYASNQVLQQDFHFDNSSFTDFLKQQGFYVADESRTNYPRSSFSIASSLNLNYLQTFKPQNTDSRPEVSIVFPLLQNHAVGRFLQSQGYKYIHMSSWFQPTKTNAIADEVLNFSSTKLDLTNFQRLLINQSMAAPLFDRWFNLSEFEQQYYGLEYQFRAFPQVVQQPGPKFVFTHIILPHGPAVFDAQCHELDPDSVSSEARVKLYLDQLQCANVQLMSMVNDIRTNDPNAIILLQSDEGSPGVANVMKGDEYTFEDASDAIREERSTMLNAYYFPDGGDSVLYPSISPVNSFRLLFNYYFGTHYDKLPNKTYLTPDSNHLFDFIDATDELTHDVESH